MQHAAQAFMEEETWWPCWFRSVINEDSSLSYRARREQLESFKKIVLKRAQARPEPSLDWLICSIFALQRQRAAVYGGMAITDVARE